MRQGADVISETPALELAGADGEDAARAAERVALGALLVLVLLCAAALLTWFVPYGLVPVG